MTVQNAHPIADNASTSGVFPKAWLRRELIRLDAHGYYMMNIIDYLVGNRDRHWGNWGVLIDNETARPLRLYDLMDFNQSFKSYDNPDGALCQTTLPRRISQRQAAIEAVRKIGLNQKKEIDMSVFDGSDDLRDMFIKRLEILKDVSR